MAIPPGNKASIARYRAKTIMQINFTLNKTTRPKMIEYLSDIENVNGYIRGLIAADMMAHGHEPDEQDK